MTLPLKFRRTREPEREAYGFIDVGTGRGILTLYAGTASSAALIDIVAPPHQISGAHVLSPQQFYSQDIASIKLNSQPTQVNVEPFFDFKFEVTKIIDGDLIAIVPNGIDRNGNTTNLFYWNEIDIIRFDGTNETSLVSGVSTTILSQTTVGNDQRVLVTNLNVNREKFKPGESLRIRVRQWINSNNTGGTPAYGIGHDPKNRNWSDQSQIKTDGSDASTNGAVFEDGDPTQMSFLVPFVIGS